MKVHHIAVVPGDGIGKEVIPVGLHVLHAVAEMTGAFRLETEEFPWGCEHYLETGYIMPDNGVEILRQFDAIYFGATGHPQVPDYLSPWRFIFVVRHAFDQYVNLRPIKLFPNVQIPIVGKGPEHVDFVIVRENTEGEFAGPGGFVHQGYPYAVAVQTSVFTYHGVRRIATYAFELARRRRKKVTNITKSNAVQYGMVFWDEVVAEVARQYPDVEYNTLYIDAATVKLIYTPEQFDVIVTTNMFGDIISDLGGVLMGSLGLGASGNINPDRTAPSMFEPFHGSAPDIAGKGIANPIGAIWAGAMMLEHLGEKEAADLIMRAITAVLAKGQVRTRDLGGNASTVEMGDAIIAALHALEQEV